MKKIHLEFKSKVLAFNFYFIPFLFLFANEIIFFTFTCGKNIN